MFPENARVSEKTVEITTCAEISRVFDKRIIWFGLTQKEEAQKGFDVAAEVKGAMLFVLQFKASDYQVKGHRRFKLPHVQLENLYKFARELRPFQKRVFYAFPDFGKTHELRRCISQCLLDHIWLLDVADLEGINCPTKKGSNVPRKTRNHHADLHSPSPYGYHVKIHSEPVIRRIFPAKLLKEFIGRSMDEIEEQDYTISGSEWERDSQFLKKFRFKRNCFQKGCKGMILLPD